MYTTMRFLRRGSVRLALIVLSLFSVAFYVYYSRFMSTEQQGGTADGERRGGTGGGRSFGRGDEYEANGSGEADDLTVAAAAAQASSATQVDEASNRSLEAAWFAWDSNTCPVLTKTKSDIDTLSMYPTLEFNPHYKEFWDENFEKRYLKRKETWNKLPLKVVVVPHSHNDPGWLKNFDGYFYSQTSNILNNMVDKLKQYRNMTFVWSDISFLAKWWKGAHHHRRESFKDLLRSGRLQILAGGWVMTDEATVHLYSMIDQMIEGHQWLKQVLNYTPVHSWSIDPFGHGSTMPYLLQLANIKGTAIQRIHHGWKTKMAELQTSDFYWRQGWDLDGTNQLLTHNFPFDIYNIKHSCGPHPQVCLTFDFRKIKGEFTEYTLKSQAINQWNVRERAETLLAQYGRTASLFPHNVALVLLGDDFRFDQALEWDQQYTNYNQLMSYINDRADTYHAHVQFGTFATYIEEIEKRMSDSGARFPVLTGDFFVYSDVFSEGRPAYWSGYFTTRPYFKVLARELQSTLRNTEVMYTLALARARQQALNRTVQILERDYARMTLARQKLADFQHHDATTGTSKAYVMHDFGVSLYDGIQLANSVMTHALQYFLLVNPTKIENGYESRSQHWPKFLFPPHDRVNYATNPKPILLTVKPSVNVELVVSNTLGQFRQELIRVHVPNKNVRVYDAKKRLLMVQFSPVWDYSAGPFFPSAAEIELSFVADLPPMSVLVFTLKWESEDNSDSQSAVTTLHNHKSIAANQFPIHLLTPVRHEEEPLKFLTLSNQHLTAVFDPLTGLLDSVQMKNGGGKSRVFNASLNFQAYVSAQFHSGAYLFMPEPRQPIINVSDEVPFYAVVRGPIYSDVIVVYSNFLRHSVRVFHRNSNIDKSTFNDASLLLKGLYMENYVEYPPPPHFRETELFFRLKTDIDSGDYFYTDQNCFQMQARRRLTQPPAASGPEVNYYPLTCMMYVEDLKKTARATLLVSHAHGASSLQSGWMEVMLERRSMYDDGRGLGEGVIDNKPTLSNFWLIFELGESSSTTEPEASIPKPSLTALQLSNNLNLAPALFAVDSRTRPLQIKSQVMLLMKGTMPCDMHLLNWKVLPVNSYFEFPSRNALLLLHRQGYACEYPSELHRCPLNADGRLSEYNRPNKVKMFSIQKTSLSALQPSTSTFGSAAKTLADVAVRPMEISAWNVTFA